LALVREGSRRCFVRAYDSPVMPIDKIEPWMSAMLDDLPRQRLSSGMLSRSQWMFGLLAAGFFPSLIEYDYI
jgi:hypothetical protein